MPTAAPPSALISHLHRTDGSATYTHNGYTIIGAVNGPIEVQRRDELPEEAVVDVIVRPAAGVGGTRERHLEAILQATLRQTVLIHNFPRSLIQVTLQVMGAPESDRIGAKLNQPGANLAVLPALLQTAILALLSATIPMVTTVTSTILAVSVSGEVIENPGVDEVEAASSVHVFAFTADGGLLLVESEGEFRAEEWEDLVEKAEELCCGGDVDKMVDEGEREVSGLQFVKTVMQEKVANDLKWRT